MQTPVFPACIQPPLQTQRGKVPFPHIIVVPHKFNNVVCPIVGESEFLAKPAVHPEQALDFRIPGMFPDGIDIFLADTQLLGSNADVERPQCNIAPARVILPHQGGEGLFRDNFVQDQVLVTIRPIRNTACGGEALIGERVTTIDIVGL